MMAGDVSSACEQRGFATVKVHRILEACPCNTLNGSILPMHADRLICA